MSGNSENYHVKCEGNGNIARRVLVDGQSMFDEKMG